MTDEPTAAQLVRDVVEIAERSVQLCADLYGLLSAVDTDLQDDEWRTQLRRARREFWELSTDVAAHTDKIERANAARTAAAKATAIHRHPATKRES